MLEKSLNPESINNLYLMRKQSLSLHYYYQDLMPININK